MRLNKIQNFVPRGIKLTLHKREKYNDSKQTYQVYKLIELFSDTCLLHNSDNKKLYNYHMCKLRIIFIEYYCNYL